MTPAGNAASTVRSAGRSAESPLPDLLEALEQLRAQVASLSLALDVDGVDDCRRDRDGLVSQFDDYLLPRLRRPNAPLLAVIGGSTGAGKSTLINSLLGQEVSRSGVLRPTTRSPVLVHHPSDTGSFLSQRILPRLTRVTSEEPEPLQPIDPNAPRITGLRLVPHYGLPPGLAIIDAPDIDSLVETNRDLAVQLLQAADMWIFVTTAARYADAMPWRLLSQAAERGATVAVVLNRVPPEAFQELRIDLAGRLRQRGLPGTPLFTILETRTSDGFLPDPMVATLRKWLHRVSGDPRSRAMIVERTLRGTLRTVPDRVRALVAAAEVQANSWIQLRDQVHTVFGVAINRLPVIFTDGGLVTGEVLARWQEFVADGGFFRSLDSPAVKVTDRVRAAFRRAPEAGAPLDIPVTQSVTDAIRSSVQKATDEVLDRWRRLPHGRGLLELRGPQVTDTDVEVRLERAVRDWRLEVSGRIVCAVEAADSGAPPELRVDLQTVSDVVFIMVIDQRAELGDTGSPASATVAAARHILEQYLGTEAVARLVTAARADLLSRAAVLLDNERRRLQRLLDSEDSVIGRGDALRVAMELVEATG